MPAEEFDLLMDIHDDSNPDVDVMSRRAVTLAPGQIYCSVYLDLSQSYFTFWGTGETMVRH
jgi:hypothetical protein